MLFYNIDSCHKICLQCWNRRLVIFKERPPYYVQVWSNRQKKLSRNVWKIWFFTNPTKPTPRKIWIKFLIKLNIKRKKRSWIFIILFSNKRVCKLFTRHSRQWVQWCSINTFCDMCRNFLSLPLQKLLNLSPLGLLNIEQIVNLNFISNPFLKGYAIWPQTFCYLWL